MTAAARRALTRAVHLGLGLAVALLVYLPPGWTGGLRAALMAVGVPLLALTGLHLWRQRAVERNGLVVGLAVAVPAAVAAQVWLQATFATVGHPASLGAANTTADPQTVRDWFATLAAQGTLDRMVATELVDLAWIGALAAVLVLGTLLAARLLDPRHPAAARRLRAIAPWTALAPGLDLVENALSLIMLADPSGFPDALAPAHAAASWLKLISIVGVAVLVPAVTIAAGRAGGRIPPRVAAPGADRGLGGADRA